MNRDDIIRMAREVFDVETDSRGRETFSGDNYGVERFAALVAAAKDAEHQQTLALQQRSYEREIQLEVEAERERIGDQCAEQIKAAIEDEREACAALLEANGMRCGEESLSRLILETNAAAIRARRST